MCKQFYFSSVVLLASFLTLAGCERKVPPEDYGEKINTESDPASNLDDLTCGDKGSREECEKRRRGDDLKRRRVIPIDPRKPSDTQ